MRFRLARAICWSGFLGGGSVLLARSFFERNPEPTKQNAFWFALLVTELFATFFLPLSVEFIWWYETLPYYTAYALKKFSDDRIVQVFLVRGFNRPNGNLLEEPVETKAPSSVPFKIAAVACVVFVFVETIVAPFIDPPSLFVWIFAPTLSFVVLTGYCLLLCVGIGKGSRYEDETRRAACEAEALRRIEREIRELLGEKV